MEGFTLPNTYHKGETEDTSKYLKDVIGLLKRFSWVYDFQLTRFATECTWKCIPVEVKTKFMLLCFVLFFPSAFM